MAKSNKWQAHAKKMFPKKVTFDTSEDMDYRARVLAMIQNRTLGDVLREIITEGLGNRKQIFLDYKGQWPTPEDLKSK